jgi:hypothetical protein
VPGMNILTAHTLLAEVGPDLSRFRTASAFASWLGLCPDNDISGGKKLSVRTRHVSNRAAGAFRRAANGLFKSHSWLGDFRRMRAKLGSPKAITAAAHQLARIVFHILTTRQPYDEMKRSSPNWNRRLAREQKHDSKHRPKLSDSNSFRHRPERKCVL